jgi:hypothetical protein
MRNRHELDAGIALNTMPTSTSKPKGGVKIRDALKNGMRNLRSVTQGDRLGIKTFLAAILMFTLSFVSDL